MTQVRVRMLTLGWLALTLLICAPANALAAALPAGSSQFVFSAGERMIDVFTYRPANCSNGPLLVVIHGMNRDADKYRDNAVTLAERFNALVIAPRFDTNQFPSEAFQRGGITRRGSVQPPEKWTYALVPRLVEEVRQRESRRDMQYFLIGHSAGGQFLTRMAAFLPGDAARIVAGNPGSHLFPTRDLPFPYGFGGLPTELSDDNAIKRYLAAPLTLLLGDADTGSQNLDVTATAMKQGATRIERGRACFQLAEEMARAKGWAFNWKKIEVPGVGHNSARLFSHTNALPAFAVTLKPPPEIKTAAGK